MQYIFAILGVLLFCTSMLYDGKYMKVIKEEVSNISVDNIFQSNEKDTNIQIENQDLSEQIIESNKSEVIKEYSNGFNLLFWNNKFSMSYQWDIIHNFETIDLSVNPFILDEWCKTYNDLLFSTNKQINQEYKSELWNNQTDDFKYDCLKEHFKRIISIDNISENIFVIKKSWYEWWDNYLYIPWVTKMISNSFWDWRFENINKYRQWFIFLFISNRWGKIEVVYINKDWEKILLADTFENITTFYRKSSASGKYWYWIKEILLKWDILIINYVSVDWDENQWVLTHYINLTEL